MNTRKQIRACMIFTSSIVNKTAFTIFFPVHRQKGVFFRHKISFLKLTLTKYEYDKCFT